MGTSVAICQLMHMLQYIVLSNVAYFKQKLVVEMSWPNIVMCIIYNFVYQKGGDCLMERPSKCTFSLLNY